MSDILDGLLRLSRTEAIEPSHAGTVDLPELTRQRLDHFTSLAEARPLELHYEADPKTLVAAETGDVETMLDNLLDNAVKYTSSGGTIRVSVQSEEEEIILTVADSEKIHFYGRE